MPQIIKQGGYSNLQVGFLTSIPYVVGCAGMLLVGFLSDKTKERRRFLIATMLMAAAGLTLAAVVKNPVLSMAAFSLAAVGILGAKGPFWPLPAAYLSGTAMAGGIAFINSIGNLGGFVGPYMVGWVKDATGSFVGGLYALAAMAMVAAVLTLICVKKGIPSGQSVDFPDSDKKPVMS